ncbi:MAG: hypothetical protein O3A63_10290 [Proteobacteria bacterium]|nr:hypothetical protein [Pseudomonadota bacterium]
MHSPNVRYATLKKLEAVLLRLIARHGARMTLGELLVITTGMALLCKQDRVSVAEVAKLTGTRKQNISRWMQKRLGNSIRLEVNAQDERIRDVILIDPHRGQEHIENLADILGTNK